MKMGELDGETHVAILCYRWQNCMYYIVPVGVDLEEDILKV